MLAALTEKEQEEDKVFWEIFDEFKNFALNKTNCPSITTSPTRSR